MREIKFRAWDRSEECMCTDVQNGIWEDPDDWLYFGDILGLERFKVMQYTGLKDKNGVEIYEGDILKCSSLIIKDDRWVEIVEVIEDIRNAYYFGNYDELEVIGNTYETPELLEAAK